MVSKTTTIKISFDTKGRLDKFKVYPRESYEEILSKMLELLNICRMDPERAKYHLITMEKQRKHRLGFIEPAPAKQQNQGIPQKPSEGRGTQR
jgi:hypothetical protein